MIDHINWGIIGCGNVTEVKSGPAFNKVPNSKLVAVMRRNGAKAADYAARHKVPKWYNSAQDLINDAEVNAIYVATPPSTHKEYTLAALAAGKPVYVEKPAAINEAECNEMFAASEKQGVKLSIAHYRRQLPLFKKVKSLLEEKAIGDIRFIDLKLTQSAKKNIVAPSEENWRIDPAISGGGIFHDLAPHQLDLMYYFFGDAKTVLGTAQNQAGLYAADDIVTGNIAFKSGVLLNGLWCFTVQESDVKDTCEIVGSKGHILFSVFSDTLKVTIDGQQQDYNIPYPPHVQQPMIEKVVAYFRDEQPNPCSAHEASIVMHWMDSMTRHSE